MYRHTISALTFVGVLALVFIVLTRTQTHVHTPTTPVKAVEKQIQQQEKVIHHYQQVVADEKKIIQAVQREVYKLREELAHVKSQRDTLLIVQVQDTLIDALTQENIHLCKVVDTQDSIIVAQRYIIDSKDTIITAFKHDLKRVKRQRNASLLVNGILTGILIFKK